MKHIGAHVSVAGGLFNGPLNGKDIGADAIGIFTKNQRQWKAPELTNDIIESFQIALAQSQISADSVLVHDSYLINLCNPDPVKRAKSLDAFIDEMKRVEQLGLSLLNFHPGSTLGKLSVEEGLKLVAGGINESLRQTEKVTAVIEMTAGQGSTLGRSFEEVASIIKQVDDKSRVGVCIDTCHIFAAGYDISTTDGYSKVMDEFGQIIGFDFLRGMHLNDSKGEAGSHLDRHHSIGKGLIGVEAFKLIMQDNRIDEIPMILETIEPEIWKEEIELLRSFCK